MTSIGTRGLRRYVGRQVTVCGEDLLDNPPSLKGELTYDQRDHKFYIYGFGSESLEPFGNFKWQPRRDAEPSNHDLSRYDGSLIFIRGVSYHNSPGFRDFRLALS